MLADCVNSNADEHNDEKEEDDIEFDDEMMNMNMSMNDNNQIKFVLIPFLTCFSLINDGCTMSGTFPGVDIIQLFTIC